MIEAFLASLQADSAAAPLVFVLAYAVATVAFMPGSMFGLAGGALFGPLWGSLWNLSGAMLGASVAFMLSRTVAGEWVARRVGGRGAELMRGIDEEGWRFVAFVRLVPLFPFNLLNYALGLTSIPFWHYVAASTLAMLPGVVLYTWVGYAGREALAGGEHAPELIVAAIALFAAVSYLPRFVRRLRARGLKWVGLTQLDALLDAPCPATVVDVRGADEFSDGALGRIPGATNIPLAELPCRLDELARRKGDPVVLVCRTQVRSESAARLLLASGFKDVAVLRDGMQAWSQHHRTASHEIPLHTQ
jgi:uncharacterized membrane protein YdjX (TVP38/TMEM64 family)/rhodanese-related sulfurtransferase